MESLGTQLKEIRPWKIIERVSFTSEKCNIYTNHIKDGTCCNHNLQNIHREDYIKGNALYSK
jgi:hypothetical protein